MLELALRNADLIAAGSGFYGLTIAVGAAADGARAVVVGRRCLASGLMTWLEAGELLTPSGSFPHP